MCKEPSNYSLLILIESHNYYLGAMLRIIGKLCMEDLTVNVL